jgi:hypothetical protein
LGSDPSIIDGTSANVLAGQEFGCGVMGKLE